MALSCFGGLVRQVVVTLSSVALLLAFYSNSSVLTFAEATSNPTTTDSTNTNSTNPSSSPLAFRSNNNNNNDKNVKDPYLYLEVTDSVESREFVKQANHATIQTLGDPTSTKTYKRVLDVLQSEERIPYVTKYGYDLFGSSDIKNLDRKQQQQPLLFNFWKDSKHPKGVWRKTTMDSYRNNADIHWQTVLDIDELSERENVNYIWRGSERLPPNRDPASGGGKYVTRTLLSFSTMQGGGESGNSDDDSEDGDDDLVIIREFDLLSNLFVSPSKSTSLGESLFDNFASSATATDGMSGRSMLSSNTSSDSGFYIPEARTIATYKSRDVLLVATDLFGPETTTEFGYPRQIREWKRGTKLADAPVVFEGQRSDIYVNIHIDDQRHHCGSSSSSCIYEIQERAISFYTTKYYVRQIQHHHLRSSSSSDLAPFVELNVPDDADIDFVGKWLLIYLRSDWDPYEKYNDGGSSNARESKLYRNGSLLYVDAQQLLQKGKKNHEHSLIYYVLFEPREQTTYDYYSVTKNYLILSTRNNNQPTLELYKINEAALSRVVGNISAAALTAAIATTANDGDENSTGLLDVTVTAIDPSKGDELWVIMSSYTQPTTVYYADASNAEEKLRIFATSEHCEKEKQREKESLLTPNYDNGCGDNDDDSEEDAFLRKEKVRSLPHFYDSSDIIVTREYAVSKDGTNIPFFLIRNKNTVLDSKNPTLLYGYGGFENTNSVGPYYLSATGIAWLERGGVYVEANIRGGGEFGPSWHQAALKANRNKCYEDFIAVAEKLIDMNFCQPSTLACWGESNGGMLVANMYIMRPDLFGAIHSSAPLLDMKRYHLLLPSSGASWIDEYGDPETSDWDLFLHKYSPYHNIDSNRERYPPILFTSSTNDPIVHPAHARKMVQKLSDLGTGKDWPVYYYESSGSGHAHTGPAADPKEAAFTTTLAYDFLFDTLSRNAK